MCLCKNIFYDDDGDDHDGHDVIIKEKNAK